MAYDLEEQEQLATLKAWWEKYGNLTSWVLIAGLAAYSGFTGWNYYQRNQATQAAALYDEVQAAVTAKDNAKVLRAADHMASDFANTTYASSSARLAGKGSSEPREPKPAKAKVEKKPAAVVEEDSDEDEEPVVKPKAKVPPAPPAAPLNLADMVGNWDD